MLIVYGAHAIPVDEKLAARLVDAGVADAVDDPTTISGQLERAVKSADAAAAYWCFQRWTDDPKATTPRITTTSKPAKKKTTRAAATKKRSKKTTRNSTRSSSSGR